MDEVLKAIANRTEGRRTRVSGLFASGGTAATSVYSFQCEVACRPGAPRPLEVRLPWSGAPRFHEVRLTAWSAAPAPSPPVR